MTIGEIGETRRTHYDVFRPRRARTSPGLRRMVAENALTPNDFIAPYFVTHGTDVQREISSMPGVYQWSVDKLKYEVEELARAGVPALMLFGIPASKDAIGSENFADDGIVQQAIRAVKDVVPEMVVLTDVCMCEYTDHGHCGIVQRKPGTEDFVIANDPTLDILRRVVVSHAAAGADIVAPSGMMDRAVAAIRQELDANDFGDIAVMGYSAKYASAF